MFKIIMKITILSILTIVQTYADIILSATPLNKMSTPIVSVREGQLKGVVSNIFDGSSYYSFKGIPYAQPPVGKLRFKAPLPVKPWEGIYNATEHGAICPQLNKTILTPQFSPLSTIVDGDENCLFINVYTKNLKPTSKTPVMVFIHGGAYLFGSGNDDFCGPDYLMQHDVVLVTINYRLEVLGFLCLDTPEVPGNAGMRDQVLALKWIKNNIAQFGGDPDNITLFGESAGAAAATDHMLSPMSRGLFHKVIAQSGVSISDWSKGMESRERAFRIGKILGKETQDPKELLEFLQTVPFETLVDNLTFKTATEEERHRGLSIYFIPVVEKRFDNVEAFLSEEPLKLIQEKKVAKVPLMIGYNSNEGIIMVNETLKEADFYNKHSGFFVPREVARITNEEKMKDMEERIKTFYSASGKFTEDEIQALCDLNSDLHFGYSIHRFTHLFSTMNTPILMYRFNCDTELNFIKKIMGFTRLRGASHADELSYLFSSIATEDDYKGKEELRQLVFRITKLWTDFARTSDPTPDNSENVKWQHYTSATKEYFEIDKVFSTGQYADKNRIEFWNKLYSEVGLPYITKSNF